jgi:hypothetical protein
LSWFYEKQRLNYYECFGTDRSTIFGSPRQIPNWPLFLSIDFHDYNPFSVDFNFR